MEEVNPNHPVTSEMREQYHKLLAIVVGLHHDGGPLHLTVRDLEAFARRWPDAAILVHSHRDSIELRLVSRKEAERLARQQGGLPT